MTPAQQREEALFAAALAKPSAERTVFLDGACLGDPALRSRLEALLAAHDATGDVLGNTPDIEALAPTLDETVGMTLGRYKLREKLGEGGCGTVYVAEQTEPVRRRVALKVIKLGMDTREVIARFEAERQALAMMDHPNIAKVLDAGTTDKGRPYFVMELVRGIRITDYCDQAQLSTKERLDLFIKVCQAIQHAHQKGIIHRDIKPSNILVTLHDGVPVPKVIDFGIAKATEGRLTDATVYTQLNQFMGTPAYMSPEQAEMSGLDIDTRSDIYSLGVLLYELLAGSTPFDAKELLASGLDAMRKTIREKEPVRPSTRLATLRGEELTTTAKRRSSEAPKLIHLLKGDLDWIVMKCLEKDRQRRYETANGLAADLKRHLNNEPVTARPPSTAYRFQKAFRRNKLVFAAASAVAIALLVGIVVTTWQVVRAMSAEQQAIREAARATTAEKFAKREAFRATTAEKLASDRLSEVGAERDAKELARQEAEAISKFLDQLFKGSAPSPDKRIITVNETLEIAAKKLETELAEQPRQRATLQATLGSTLRALGFLPQAIRLLEKVREYHVAASGAEHPDSLLAMGNLAGAYYEAKRGTDAIRVTNEKLAACLKTDPASPATAAAYASLGFMMDAHGRSDEAIRAWQQMARIQPNPDATYYWLGKALADSGRYDEALPILRATQQFYQDGLRALETAEWIAESEAMLEATNGNGGAPERRSELLTRWLNAVRATTVANSRDTEKPKFLTTIYLWLGQSSEHEAFCRTQLETAANLVDPRALDRLAKPYLLQMRPDPELLQMAVAAARAALKLSPADDRDRAWFLVTAGMAAVRDRQPAEAEALLTEALAVSENERDRRGLALAYRAMARVHLGRVDEAQADFAALEKLVLPLPARQPISRILRKTGYLSVCIAYEEAKALLRLPAARPNPINP